MKEYNVLDVLESGEITDIINNDYVLDHVSSAPGFKFNLYRYENDNEYYTWIIKYNGEIIFAYEDEHGIGVDYDNLIKKYNDCDNFNVLNIRSDDEN